MTGSVRIGLAPTAEQAALIEKTMACCAMLWNRTITDEARLQAELGRRLVPTPAKYKREFPELKDVDSLALNGLHHALLRDFRNHDYNPHDNPRPAPVDGLNSYTTYSKQSKGGFMIRIEGGGIRLPKLGLVPIIQSTELPEDMTIQAANVQKEKGSYFCKIKYECHAGQLAAAVEKQPA